MIPIMKYPLIGEADEKEKERTHTWLLPEWEKMKAQRVEEIKIKMTLDKKAYARHSHEVTTLVKPVDMNDADDLNVNYPLFCTYFGGVVEALHTVKKICADPNVVISASCDDLTSGRVLIYEALKNLDAIIQEIEKRKN